MDWDRLEGDWKQLGGKVKARWGKLTDDDLAVIKGQRDQLEGRIQSGTATQRVRLEEKSRTGTASQSLI